MEWNWTTALIALSAFILAWIILRWLFKSPGNGGSVIGNIVEGVCDVID